jgi:oligoribonuclease
MKNTKNLAWLDLETTGLDPAVDQILQAALVITDGELNVLEEVVVDIWHPAEKLTHMTPFVRAMHEKTGLLQRVSNSMVDISSAERKLFSVLIKKCEYPAILCGNTVGFDRRFVNAYFKGIAAYLHYRMIDVSSLKLLTEHWYDPTKLYAKPEDMAHDALFDIRQSIAELAHYRKTILQKP